MVRFMIDIETVADDPKVVNILLKTNSDQAADETINVTSHEQMEAATDPLLNAWLDSSGQEIGDKCAWTFGTTNADGSNVNWNGNPYLVQQEWDNAQSGCVLTGP